MSSQHRDPGSARSRLEQAGKQLRIVSEDEAVPAGLRVEAGDLATRGEALLDRLESQS